jgi:hypothetical protein
MDERACDAYALRIGRRGQMKPAHHKRHSRIDDGGRLDHSVDARMAARRSPGGVARNPGDMLTDYAVLHPARSSPDCAAPDPGYGAGKSMRWMKTILPLTDRNLNRIARPQRSESGVCGWAGGSRGGKSGDVPGGSQLWWTAMTGGSASRSCARQVKLAPRACGSCSANTAGKVRRATSSSTDRRGNPGRAWREQRQRVSRRSGPAVGNRARAFEVPSRLGCPIADRREVPLWVDNGLSAIPKADARGNVSLPETASTGVGHEQPYVSST